MMNKSFISSLVVVLASAVVLTGTAVTAQSWDGGAASNNDDGGNDNGDANFQTTSDDTSSGDSGGSEPTISGDSWDGGDATNDDDGTGTQQSWDGGDATNDDDGSSSSNQWDGGSASNDDDGSSTSWDGEDATNDDDGTSSSANEEDANEEQNTEESDSSDNSDQESENEPQNEAEETDRRSGGSGDGEIDRPNITIMQPEFTSVDVPSTVEVGEEVEVDGKLEYPRTRDVSVLVDGRTVAETEVNKQNNFAAEFQLDTAGEHTVRLQARDASATRQLTATNGVEVSNLDAPSRVSTGRNVDVCADVSSSVEPTVTFSVDGVQTVERTGTGRQCFETDLSWGSHTVKVEASTGASSDSETTVVRVTGDRTQQVSQDLSDSPQSSAGIFQSLIQMLASMVGFVASLVPVI